MPSGGRIRSTEFALLCLMGAFAIFSSTASKSPLLSWFAGYLGATEFEIGLIASASTVTGVVVNVSAGALSDVYGRRKLLLTSAFIFASAPFLYLLVRTPWQLGLLRVYHGVATAVFTPVSMAAIADMFPPESRGKTMGTFSSATMVGRLVAPAASGALVSVQLLGPFRLAYLVCGVMGSISLALALRLDVGSGPEDRGMSPRDALRGISSVLRDHRVLLVSSAEAASYFSLGGVEAFLPLYADLVGMERWVTGALMGLEVLTVALVKPATGALSDRLGRVRFILAGLAVSAAGSAALALARDPLTIGLCLVAHGVGTASATSATSPLISEIAPRSAVGSGLGALESIKDVGHASGPIVAGALAWTLGYRAAFLGGAIAPVIDAVAVAILLGLRGLSSGGGAARAPEVYRAPAGDGLD